MTSLDDRAKGLENKYAHDEELSFKAIARRNKLLGLWAAEKMGKNAEEASSYAKDVVLSDFESEGDGDVIAKLLKDFYNAEIEISEQEIIAEMERLLPIAKSQMLGTN
jgi:hypothetical protein